MKLLPIILAIGSVTLFACAEQNALPPEVLAAMHQQGSSGTPHNRQYPTYTGEYLCEQGGTGLNLQILGDDGHGMTYGIFHFFPLPTNPNVPAGSFVLKGLFDVDRGMIQMEPTTWITRPIGYRAVGLNGASTDGSVTFEGQVTGILVGCSTFKIRRNGVAAS
jgi:hypothetical protein